MLAKTSSHCRLPRCFLQPDCRKTPHAMTGSIDIRRRDFLNWGTQGLAATALVSLLRGDGLLAADAPHGQAFSNIAPRVKRAIHICLIGGMIHIDSFDYKPTLVAMHENRWQRLKNPMSSSAKLACSANMIGPSNNAVRVVCGFQKCFRTWPASQTN